MSIYDYQGNVISSDNSVFDYDKTVKGVAHRGYSSNAPENTLPAYKLAKQNGFYYVETDISFTSDGVPVLLHDASIDRTSNGSGNINDLTWSQVQQYDFGSWKSAKYVGTKIPSFEQFIKLCRDISLHPYIELKTSETYTESQITGLVDIVKAYGLQGKVTWISFSTAYLGYIKNYDEYARLGAVTYGANATWISYVKNLETGTNEVFVDASTINDGMIELCVDADLPLEAWTINDASTILSMNPYVTGVTSDSLIAGKVLYEAAMT